MQFIYDKNSIYIKTHRGIYLKFKLKSIIIKSAELIIDCRPHKPK